VDMGHTGMVAGITAALLVAWCQVEIVKASAGPYFPIRRENLYDGYRETVSAECRSPAGLTPEQWRECMVNNVLSVDYTCRYSLFHYSCYCCGAFFHFIEQGPVCTKYCLKSQDPPRGQGRFCQNRVIILPFNFGDQVPEEITLDVGRGDTSKVPIPFEPTPDCPTDPTIPDSCYGPRPVPLSSYWDPTGSNRNVSRERPARCSHPAKLVIPRLNNIATNTPVSDKTSKRTTRRPRPRPTQRTRTTTTTTTRATTTTRVTTTRRTTTIKPNTSTITFRRTTLEAQNENRLQSSSPQVSSDGIIGPGASEVGNEVEENPVWSGGGGGNGRSTAAQVVDIRSDQ